MANVKNEKLRDLIDNGLSREEVEEAGFDPDKILEYRRRLPRFNDESKVDKKSEEVDDAV